MIDRKGFVAGLLAAPAVITHPNVLMALHGVVTPASLLGYTVAVHEALDDPLVDVFSQKISNAVFDGDWIDFPQSDSRKNGKVISHYTVRDADGYLRMSGPVVPNVHLYEGVIMRLIIRNDG